MDSPVDQTYRPLSNSEPQFRLLYLQPIDGSQHEDEPPHIVGRVEIESIDCTFRYEALSYVWGDATDCVNITINGIDFPVTRNLYKALKHLVLADRERVIWIDAICINQADLEERSQQVKHMRSIYQNASSVYVSLGDPYDGMESALEYLALAAEDGSRHFEPGLDNCLSVGDLDANSNELAIAIVKLFYLPWWRRLWTVQEYLLAREVYLYCGQHVISSSMLIRAANNLMRHGQLCCNPDSGSFQSRFFLDGNNEESHNVWHGCNILLGLGPAAFIAQQSFHKTLSIFRMRQTTDPRDKIYGLLGLAPKEIDGLAPLDYTSPVEEIYEAFTVEYVRHYKNLRILGAIGGTRQLPNLPSFCPDWTIVSDKTSRYDETMFIQMSNRMIVQQMYLEAHCLTEAKWSQTERGAVNVNGFVFDVIQEVSLECFRQLREIRRPWAESILTLAGQTDILTLLRALCGDIDRSRDVNHFSLIQPDDKAMEDRLRKWWDWTLSDGISGPARDGEISRVESAVLQTCSGRSFVVTQKGYIGCLFYLSNCA